MDLPRKILAFLGHDVTLPPLKVIDAAHRTTHLSTKARQPERNGVVPDNAQRIDGREIQCALPHLSSAGTGSRCSPSK
jgi:hypothetical protein